MKKRLLIICGIIIAVVLLCGGVILACLPDHTDSQSNPTGTASTSTNHVHEYKVAVTTPTCTEQGYSTYTCHCGASYIAGYKDAVGHEWGEWTVVREPTTTTEGLSERTCANCGEVEQKPIDKVEQHLHGYTATIVSPTCTEDGYTLYSCACGDSYKEDIVKALGHSYVTTKRDATCTEDGYTTHTCSVCGDIRRDAYVKALGHDYGNWTTVKEPGCETEGQEQSKCNRCGKQETRPIAATGHTWTEERKEATCTEPGSVKKTCGTCGKVVTETIEATGHKWTDWEVTKAPTEESAGEKKRTCSCCGEVEIEEVPAIGDGEYEPYIDPRIEVIKGKRNTKYRYNDISIYVKNGWKGEQPSIWVNNDGSLTVEYINLDGTRVEAVVAPPPEGYVRMWTLMPDGTFVDTLIGDPG